MFFGEEDELGAVRLATGQTYQQRILATPGLIAYLPMTELAGITAGDAKSGNNWTYTNGPTLNQLPGPGDSKPWVLFDGLNDTVDPSVGALAALNAVGGFNPLEGTIILWAQIPAALLADANQYAFGELGNNGNNRILLAKDAGAVFNVYMFAGGNLKATGDIGVGDVPFALALTWSASANIVQTYLNGVALGAPVVYPTSAWVGPLTAGWTQIGGALGGTCWPGLKGRFQIYNRALSLIEIAARSVMP